MAKCQRKVCERGRLNWKPRACFWVRSWVLLFMARTCGARLGCHLGLGLLHGGRLGRLLHDRRGLRRRWLRRRRVLGHVFFRPLLPQPVCVCGGSQCTNKAVVSDRGDLERTFVQGGGGEKKTVVRFRKGVQASQPGGQTGLFDWRGISRL